MKAKILIFENDVYIAEEMAIRLRNAGYQEIAIAISKNQALKALEVSYPDIAILDIRAPGDKEAGINIAKFIRQKQAIPIIYFTAHPNDKSFVYDTKPNAFIEKPNYVDVVHAIDIAVQNFYKKNNPIAKEDLDLPLFSKKFLFILKNGIYFKIKNEDILYVKADHGCIIIHTIEGNFPYSSTIKRFAEQLDDPYFISVHRSYFINFRHIDSFDTQHVSIVKNKIPMSKTGSKALLKIVHRLRAK